MAAIESLDQDLVLIIIVSTINSSIKELSDITSQSTVELNLSTFLSKMNELAMAYTKAFNLTPIDVKVDKSTLVSLLKEKKIADFVQVTDDILKIETNAKAFQAILSNIAVTSTLNYAKLLIKNIDDLGIMYRSSIDKTETTASKEENDSLQDISNTEKYTIEEENDSSEVQEGTENNEKTNEEITNKMQEIEAQDEEKQDEIVVQAENHIEGQEAEIIKEQNNNDLINETIENAEQTNLKKPLEMAQEDEKEQGEVEKDDDSVKESPSEEQDEHENKEGSEDKVIQEDKNKEEEQEEKKEQEESNEGEEKEEVEGELKSKQEDHKIQGEEDNVEEEKTEDIREDKAELLDDKDIKKDKAEHRKTTPVDSTNALQTPEPKLSDSNAKEELRSQSSRKRSRSLSISTPQQHKRFQHIAVNLINNIQAHRFSSPFLQPVNSKEAPDYHEVIYEPKDLKNILKSIKLKSDPPEYQLIKQLKRDILLMLANCIMYNKSDTDLVQLTKSMKNDVNNIFKLFEEAELDTK